MPRDISDCEQKKLLIERIAFRTEEKQMKWIALRAI
jgi:hypothetical protein